MRLWAAAPITFGFALVALVPAVAFPATERETERSLFDNAIVLFDQGEYDGSRKILERLLRSKPGSALYWYNLGNACLMEGRWSEAAEAYDHVDRIGGPLAVTARLYRVRAYELMGHDQRARETSVAQSPEKPWSLVLDGTGGASGASGYQFSANAAFATLRSERAAISLGAAAEWLQGFEKDASSLLTASGSAALSWRKGQWLVSGEPYVSERLSDLRPALLEPGARVGLQFLEARDRYGVEYSQEYAIPLAPELEPERGTSRQARGYRSSEGGNPEWRLGALGRQETASGLASVGPEAYLDSRLGARWDLEGYASLGIGSIPAGGESPDRWALDCGARVSWRARSDIRFHAGLSGTTGPSASQLTGLAGVSWVVL